MGFFNNSGIYKTPDELRKMVAPGLATHAGLVAARELIVAGNMTGQIDAAAEAAIIAAGGASNFKLVPGYSHTICASVNDEVVHGIPGKRVLKAGDIVKIDCGAILDGWNGDSAITVVIPDPTQPELVTERETLSTITEGALWAGIAELTRAKHLNEIGARIEGYIEDEGDKISHRFGILTDYVGHGIGRDMHEDPSVFNYRVKQKGPEIKPGLCLAIEPMVVVGSPDTHVLADGWTVSTNDGSSSCQWEHTVVVHGDGIWVTTAPDGGAAGLARFGVTPVPIP